MTEMYDAFNLGVSLLGKNVVVKLAEQVVARGRLLVLNDWGEVVLEDEMGGLHYCWPMLDISEDVTADVDEDAPPT
jgi:hypothetical protein